MPGRRPKKTDIYENIRRVVRVYMNYRGLTGEEVALAIGLSRNTFYARMNAETRWTPLDIERLAELFEIEPGDFFRAPPSLELRHNSGYARESGVASPTPGHTRRTAA